MTARKRLIFNSVVILAITLFAFETSYSQDSIAVKKARKNSIKINITNPMIFGEGCYILGYERTVGQHQSFSVNLGRFALPKLFSIGNDSIKDLYSNSYTSRGLSFSTDYRFYLGKENKYNSPHGIYIGPYFARNSFSRKFEVQANAGDLDAKANLDFKFGVTTLGFQMGYQFIFWDRVSLDMMMFGPGISFYSLKANLSTSLDPEREAELFKMINDKLAEKIPGYDKVISPGEFEKTGNYNTTNAGYRYIIMIGFRF
jgi:hypothetical protein